MRDAIRSRQDAAERVHDVLSWIEGELEEVHSEDEEATPDDVGKQALSMLVANLELSNFILLVALAADGLIGHLLAIEEEAQG
jgi:hypothetical protein